MADSASPAPRWGVAPYFLVADVVAAANDHRDRLGFAYERFWGEPPAFCMVYRRGVVIMLKQAATAGAPRLNHRADSHADAWDAYVWVDDADLLHSEVVARGATVIRPPCDQEYGCRDFEVDDRDGYRLCFGHNLTARPHTL